jgi:hypothetical protein
LNDASNKIPLGHPIKFRLADPNGKVTYQTVQKSNEWNHYAFTVPTANDAQEMGAMVSVGGAKFTKASKLKPSNPIV